MKRDVPEHVSQHFPRGWTFVKLLKPFLFVRVRGWVGQNNRNHEDTKIFRDLQGSQITRFSHVISRWLCMGVYGKRVDVAASAVFLALVLVVDVGAWNMFFFGSKVPQLFEMQDDAGSQGCGKTMRCFNVLVDRAVMGPKEAGTLDSMDQQPLLSRHYILEASPASPT